MRTITLTVVLLSTIPACAPEQKQIDHDDVVASIVSEGVKGRDPKHALQQVELLRDSLAEGNELEESAGKKLLSVVANAQAHGRVRHATLELVCDYATPDSAEEIVAVMATLFERLPRPKDDEPPGSEYYVIPGWLHVFVTEEIRRFCLSSTQVFWRIKNYILDIFGKGVSSESPIAGHP